MKKVIVSITLALTLFAAAGCATHSRVELDPPLRFLLLGDSIMAGYFGYMLEHRLREMPGVQVLRIGVKSTGLSEFIRFDWHGKTLQYIKWYRPDVVVILFGGNDCYALRRPDGTLLLFTQEGWRDEYAARLDRYLDDITPMVKRVYLVGQPSTNHPYFETRYPVLNKVFRAQSRKHAGVRYIPAWDMTSEKGLFVAVMKDGKGQTGAVKYPNDPIHHTPFGGRVLTERFLDYISDEFHPPAVITR
ncbi:MAG TPA: DUF459 domain-containing protein [Spirochaetota bacterium]|nr:DUF459 domain-containing protein [Spirochaetota bacterium]